MAQQENSVPVFSKEQLERLRKAVKREKRPHILESLRRNLAEAEAQEAERQDANAPKPKEEYIGG